MFKLNNILSPPAIIAQTKDWQDINSKCVTDGVPTIIGIECLFANILQVITTVAGLAFFAMFIVGGFKYLTAGGDPKKAAAASSTLGLAVIGLVGVIVSWLILTFIQNITGISVTEFSLDGN